MWKKARVEEPMPKNGIYACLICVFASVVQDLLDHFVAVNFNNISHYPNQPIRLAVRGTKVAPRVFGHVKEIISRKI